MFDYLKRDKSEKRIFISHWSEEELLAEYVKDYLEKIDKNVKCFCSSRDMMPGDWRMQIGEKARETKVALLMISPLSKSRNWIQYESGIVFGANPKNVIIPVLFGGATKKDIPDTISNYQAVSLNDLNSFEKSVPKIISANVKVSHSEFISSMNPTIKRLCLYGHNSLMVNGSVNEEKINEVYKVDNHKHRFLRNDGKGEIASFRLKMIPRQTKTPIHWKTGVTIFKNNNRVIKIHAGRHAGYATWTIYHIPSVDSFKYEVPVQLDMDKECCIYLWFDKDRKSIVVELVDSNGSHELFLSDTNNTNWLLSENDWDNIEVEGWCDNNEIPYKTIEYKTETIVEIDRI